MPLKQSKGSDRWQAFMTLNASLCFRRTSLRAQQCRTLCSRVSGATLHRGQTASSSEILYPISRALSAVQIPPQKAFKAVKACSGHRRLHADASTVLIGSGQTLLALNPTFSSLAPRARCHFLCTASLSMSLKSFGVVSTSLMVAPRSVCTVS